MYQNIIFYSLILKRASPALGGRSRNLQELRMVSKACALYTACASSRTTSSNILTSARSHASTDNLVVRSGVGKETHPLIVVAKDGQIAEDGRANSKAIE